MLRAQCLTWTEAGVVARTDQHLSMFGVLLAFLQAVGSAGQFEDHDFEDLSYPVRLDTDLLFATMVFCIGVVIASGGSEPTTTITVAAPQRVARPGSVLGPKQHKLSRQSFSHARSLQQHSRPTGQFKRPVTTLQGRWLQ